MKISANNSSGNAETSFITAAQPMIGGNAPAAPPMTMFCGVLGLSQMV